MSIITFLETKEYRENQGLGRHQWLDNLDLRPVPQNRRTYTWQSYFWFWISANATPATFYGVSAALAAGLGLWEALMCQLGGQIMIATVFCFNGRAGAVYHIPYPVIARACFGIWGAYWPIVNRVVMTLVWTGVNAVQGGQCAYVLLHALFPSIANIPDVFPAGVSALNSGGMIGFMVFWIVTTSLLHIKIPDLRPYMYTKLIIFAVCSIALLVWALIEAGGIGTVARQGSTISGSAKSWAIARYIWIYCANGATYATNAADFLRYAKKPKNAWWPQLIGFPLSTLIYGLIGNLIVSSSVIIFGELVWNPIDLLDMLLAQDYSSGKRAGVFFLSLGFMYASVISSIFENSIPAGNDLAALWPRFISIRRGFYLAAVISYAMCPWYILGTASSFVSWLASYQIFLSSITGVMLCQYFLISKGYLQIPDFYTSRSTGLYYYRRGWNYRAYIAYVIGVAPNFYGFLGVFGVSITETATRMYYFAYPVGLILSFASYYGLCWLDPPPCSKMEVTWQEPVDYFEPEDILDGMPPVDMQETIVLGTPGTKEV
ncbi:permease for cytosine/purines, uracil, thiamine, allantoin-domain-containing protein [Talaromyces proteolyticus]|uniref:Permease for cytosine/purines, uracil, thiamine, allantoin-domain-containing protein n=1 Tax=Talaromyces proteolyticus TaxID=1131652 RepID=A0AAD4KEZ3_9EURO|nr:permease for cytosine/purines, uracil, thiamine, allantoin-domain-containing protein [Talaromyces proteolyticus]KAH8690450.1 permease for cytosine/purines, uracil, thiamine, allantoin-domain-containing protein [Talaromyces proteolyticus]